LIEKHHQPAAKQLLRASRGSDFGGGDTDVALPADTPQQGFDPALET
jgi:hypothetical protein